MRHYLYSIGFMKDSFIHTVKQLIPFLEFVRNHPATGKKDRATADEVAEIIRNIETYGNSRNWCICFSLYSEKLLAPTTPFEGLYRYDWWVHMESGVFTVEGEKRFYPFSHETLDFFFHYSYNFRLDTEYNSDGNDLSSFINDVIHYQRYITDYLVDVETEIGMW